MQIYRITKSKYANLDGIGGILVSGRWHEKGNRSVYCSENRALALLENLVRINDFTNLPNDLVQLTIKTPDDIPIYKIDHSKLPKNWTNKILITRKMGSEVLIKNEYLLMQVPSVIVPEENNFILNPVHELTKECEIIESKPIVFDTRFMRK
jgi:RES domain-containing protein